jgi:DNA polymerase-1
LSPPAQSLYLVDANAYVHRAYHALPPMNNSRGEPTQALFGFARMLLKLLKQQRPDRIAVCFDTAAPTFRHKAYAAYKAHRKETDDALKFQLPLSREMAQTWGFPVLAVEGYEADDLIATMAEKGRKKGFRVVIVTGDKDALQLVDPSVSVLNEHKGILFTPEEVEKKYGLRPDQLVDFFALTGDSSDNVPGVPGVGPKTAVPLLQRYGTLDSLLEHLGELKGSVKEKLESHRESAVMSRSLVVLDRDAPVGLAPEDCLLREGDPAALQALFQRFEFSSLLAERESAVAGPSTSAGRSRGPAPAPTEPAAPPAKNADRVVRTVLTREDLKALGRALRSAEAVAVDVETTGVDALGCSLVGVAAAVKPGEGWYVPIGHKYLGAPEQLPLKAVIAEIAPVLADPKVPKVGQNLKFDHLVLKRHGAPLSGIGFDTLIASYCLNPSRMSHGLKDLARDILAESMTPIEELIGKGAKQTGMDQAAVEAAAPYAAADAEVVLRLKAKMAPLLQEKGLEKLYYEMELPLVMVLAGMEETGIRVDVPYLRRLAAEFVREIGEIETSIYETAGERLNLNSPKQLAVLLFEKLKLPVVRRTKTGFSTDEEVLQKLSDKHPLPARLLQYRELAKLKSTYIDALLELAHPADGRVHTRFNQAVAATGRLSSSDPNLQNIPIRTEHGRRIRKAFVPEKDWVFLSADYSQIDLRVLAHVSGDPALCEAFRRGEDIHSATAREIFGLAAGEAPTTDQRRVAKSVNFGIVYGQTAYGLSQQIGLGFAEAQSYIDRYFARYAGVKRWIESILETARKDGHVTTLLHRIRYLPEIHAPNTSVRQFAERTAMNTPIQGTSADIIKVAMLDVARDLAKGKSKARLLVQVHDELLFELPAAELKTTAPLIRRRMEEAVKLDIPLVVDLKKGVNWSEMEKIDSDR